MVLNANLPQLLGGFVVGQFETNGAFILLLLWDETNKHKVKMRFIILIEHKKRDWPQR